MRDDLHPKAKCYKCKGCYQLNNPEFKGLIQCCFFEQKEQKVWCADESVEKYIRAGKIK